MIRNAAPGEYIFFNHWITRKRTKKRKSLVITNVPGKIHKHGIREAQLNSLGRSEDKIWVESEYKPHEAKYMKRNSEGYSFL